MNRILAIAAVALAAVVGGVKADYVPDPAPVTAVNHVGGLKATPPASKATAPASPQALVEKPLPAAPSYRLVRTTRAPVGHTHTCANGHTWDHQANPTHTCRECGLSQYYQDPSPRPVTVLTRVATQGGTIPASQPAAVPYQPQTYPPQPSYATLTPAFTPSYTQGGYFLPAASGGCSNGSCSNPGFTNRGGLFGRNR